VVDTSVALKWFVEEEGSKKARKILEQYKSGSLEILAPEIIGLELANALFYGVSLKGKRLKEAIELFYSLGLSLVPLDRLFIQEAASLMEKVNIAIYDCLFIALAEKEKIPLVTADTRHHQKRFSQYIQPL